jgi:hypothetical protein
MLPFAVVVAVAGPILPRRRYFAACRSYGGGLPVLGQAVVEEFQTISAPVCLVPRALAGKVYDQGLARSFARDPEMGIDAGWPPLVVGVDLPTPALPVDWAEQLARVFDEPAVGGSPKGSLVDRRSLTCSVGTVELVLVAGSAVVATDARLLPRQLRRLAEAVVAMSSLPATNGVVVALGTGTTLATVDDGVEQDVAFVGEGALDALIGTAARSGPARAFLPERVESAAGPGPSLAV